jgi:hypothetical protein
VTHDDVERGTTYEVLGRAQVVVDHERWRHALDRHPELDEMLEAVDDLIKAPDEIFVDPHDTFHLVKKLTDGPSDFLVSNLHEEVVSRILRRLMVHGLVTKTERTYKGNCK